MKGERSARNRSKMHWMAGFALALVCTTANAQLKGTEMFDDRPVAQRRDAESRLDAIKRERLEEEKKQLQVKREQEVKRLNDRCSCFYPTISTDFICTGETITLTSESKEFRALPFEKQEAIRRANQARRDRERQERARWRAEMHQTCKAWANGGREISEQEYKRRVQDMQARVDAAGREERRLVLQREMKKAEQSIQRRQAEKDRIKSELQRQADAANDRARREQLKSQQEMEAFRDRQRDQCKAEVARHGYPYSCACRGVLNWHVGNSCAK